MHDTPADHRSSPQPPALSIIMPLYNEEGAVVTSVEKNLLAIRSQGIDFEILLVDDASVDRTPALMDELATNEAEVRAFHRAANGGQGAAVRSGIAEARGVHVLVVPADCPVDAATLNRFAVAAPEADLILGYRTERPGYTGLMRMNTRVYHWILRRVAGLSYRDVNGIHCYRRSIFNRITLEFEGIAHYAEVVLKAHRLGMRIVEVPCPFPPRVAGTPSAGRFPVMARTGLDLLRLLWRDFTTREHEEI